MYEIVYDFDDDDRNIREIFNGSWCELQVRIEELKHVGFYNINAAYIGE